MKKIQQLRNKIVRHVSQIYAEFLIKKIEASIGENQEYVDVLFEQCAKLNAYCIVFHNIYLD